MYDLKSFFKLSSSLFFTCFITFASAQIRVELGWYKVIESTDTLYWSLNQNIQAVENKDDTIQLQGIANFGGSLIAHFKNQQLEIPEQAYQTLPFGGKDAEPLKILMKGKGAIQNGILSFHFFMKWDGLDEFKEIKIRAKYYLPKQQDKPRVSDTVLDGRYFQYVLYSLNKWPSSIGEIYTNVVKNGLWYSFDQQERLVSKATYCNDTLHGWSESYYHFQSQASRKIEGQYYYGMQVGEFKNYVQKKRDKWLLEGSIIYGVDGRQISKRLFYPNGQISYDATYNAASEVIWYKFYSESGKLIKSGNTPPDIVLE